MSAGQVGPEFSVPSGSDLSASQYVGVDINSSGELIVPTGAGAAIIGVLQNKPDAQGKAGTVRRMGTKTKGKLGGTVAVADRVKVDSAGRFVTASAGDIAAGAAVGTCILGGAINNIGEIELGIMGVGTTLVQGAETITTGAASVLKDTTYLSVTGTKAYTLADGVFIGQRKYFECSVAASTPIGTLTPANVAGTEPASWRFDVVGQSLELEWQSGGWHTIAVRGQETVVSGVVSLGRDTTLLSVTGTVAYSLADGVYIGQRKRFEVTVAASTPVGTLTPATVSGSEPATWVFGAVGQMVEFEWLSDGWKVVGIRTAGVDTPAAGSTLLPLILIHTISITGTQDWILGNGVIPGIRKHFIVSAAASTPVGTISGLFYDDADGSADSTDLNLDAAADAAVMTWDGARWMPSGLVAATT